MAYSHCTERDLDRYRALYTIGDNWSGSCPCLRPVSTFLYNIFGPINPGSVPCTCLGLGPCSVNKPLDLENQWGSRGWISLRAVRWLPILSDLVSGGPNDWLGQLPATVLVDFETIQFTETIKPTKIHFLQDWTFSVSRTCVREFVQFKLQTKSNRPVSTEIAVCYTNVCIIMTPNDTAASGKLITLQWKMKTLSLPFNTHVNKLNILTLAHSYEKLSLTVMICRALSGVCF